MSRRLPQWIGIGIALIAVSVWHNIAEKRENRRLAPPADVRTLAEFVERMPAPTRLLEATDGSIIWLGDRKQFPSVPSGPACYRFDRTGGLVDWYSETGEGGPLDAYTTGGNPITLEQALELVGNAN